MLKFLTICSIFALIIADKHKDAYGLRKINKPDSLKVQKTDQVMDILESDTQPDPKFPHILGPPNSQLCSICQTLLGAVSEYVKEHETSIPEALNALCEDLFEKHESERDLCEVIVESQLKNIIKYIEEGTEPEIACKALSLC